MRKLVFFIMALTLLAGAMSARVSFAGVWEQPTVPPAEIDEFPSVGWKTLELLPAWTGFPDPILVEFHGEGNKKVGRRTQVVRDPLNAAFDQGGRDTINTEIVDFQLVGQAEGFDVVIQAGFGNSFFGGGVGLDHTRGQIQDNPGSPLDGVIDFPADSIFDVFFDIWVDLNNDMLVDVGEVLSNDIRDAAGDPVAQSHALRMQQMNLEAVPPPLGTQYLAWDIISALDPAIGTFWANSLPLPLDLYPILPDRQAADPPHARVTAAIHEVGVPEIDAASGLSALTLLLGILGLMGERIRRTQPSSAA